MKTIYELYLIESLELVVAGTAASDYSTTIETVQVLRLIDTSEDIEELKQKILQYSYRGNSFTILTTYQF